jgi:Protein of unknown function (DUF1800)
MELHTLGVDGGYSQGDVIALAHILTGWGFVRRTGAIMNQTGPDRGFDSSGVLSFRGFPFDRWRRQFSDGYE